MRTTVRSQRVSLLLLGLLCIATWNACSRDAGKPAASAVPATPADADVTTRPGAQGENQPELKFTPEAQRVLGPFVAATQKKDWDRAAALLAQISELERGNVFVTKYRAHYLAYVISAEHDALADCYRWKRAGVEALLDGLADNPEQPDLLYDIGWYLGPGLGRGRPGLRKHFGPDGDLHEKLSKYVSLEVAKGPTGQPDSWLAAKLFYQRATDAYQRTGSGFDDQPTPLLAFSAAPAAQANYAEALQQDEFWGRSAAAWKEAERLFLEFEKKELPDSSGAKSPLAGAGPADIRRRIVNLDAWLIHCQLEQRPDVLRSRQNLRRAEQAAQSGNFDSSSPTAPGARQLFREAFSIWTEVLPQFPDGKKYELVTRTLKESAETCRRHFGNASVPAPILEYCAASEDVR